MEKKVACEAFQSRERPLGCSGVCSFRFSSSDVAASTARTVDAADASGVEIGQRRALARVAEVLRAYIVYSVFNMYGAIENVVFQLFYELKYY